jgi:hypothetical protein
MYFLITLSLQLFIYLFDQIITIRYVRRLKEHYSNIEDENLNRLSLQIDKQEWTQMVQESRNKILFDQLEATYGFISENGILLSGVFIWILNLSKSIVHYCMHHSWFLFGYMEMNQIKFMNDNIVIWNGVMFLFIVSLFSSICKAPFEVFRVFVIENRSESFWHWLFAQIKMGFLAVVVGAPLLSLILWLINIGGGEQWIYIWVGAGALSVGTYELYPSVLLPLFYNISLTKSSVMEDCEEEDIDEDEMNSDSTDGKVKGTDKNEKQSEVYEQLKKNKNEESADRSKIAQFNSDYSKDDGNREQKEEQNISPRDAYFSRNRWNPFFRKLGIEDDKWQVVVVEHHDIVNAFTVEKSGILWIVVYSPLLELSVEEVQAVIAHEVCHYQNRHSAWTIGLHLFSLAVFLFLFSLVAYRSEFYASFGFDQVDTGVGLCLFSYLYSPVASLINMASNYIQRSWEFKCDIFAQQHGTNIREALISMCDLNAGVDAICGTGMYSVYNRQHPSLLERILWLDSCLCK